MIYIHMKQKMNPCPPLIIECVSSLELSNVCESGQLVVGEAEGVAVDISGRELSYRRSSMQRMVVQFRHTGANSIKLPLPGAAPLKI